MTPRVRRTPSRRIDVEPASHLAAADPVLELHDSNGDLLASNDNWQDTQGGIIDSTGLAPDDPNESAIFANLAAGAYTAVVQGTGSSTGVGLVEVYNIP